MGNENLQINLLKNSVDNYISNILGMKIISKAQKQKIMIKFIQMRNPFQIEDCKLFGCD